ncbi:MAG: hypothetical protein RIR96_1584 [Bacteroidota bacterium]
MIVFMTSYKEYVVFDQVQTVVLLPSEEQGSRP